MKRAFVLGVLVFVFSVQVSWAQIPETISFQGVLTDASGITPVPNGNFDLTFSLYDVATGGVPLWSEVHPAVPVAKGIFSVILGAGNPPQPLTLPFDRPYWLSVTVDTEPEFTPRIQLTASAYSLNTRSVADDAVTSDKIATGQVVKSINSLKDSVTLAAGMNITITPNGNTLTISAQGGAGSGVTSINSLAGNIVLAAGANMNIVPDGNNLIISMTGIPDNSVTTGKLADGAVTGPKISVPLYVNGSSDFFPTIWGVNSGNSNGVSGTSTNGSGVYGQTTASNYAGVFGTNTNGYGVYGQTTANSHAGVSGYSENSTGVYGSSINGDGVYASSTNGNGVYGFSTNGNKAGVYGVNHNGTGVWGVSENLFGVLGVSAKGTAVRAIGNMSASGFKSAQVKLDDGTLVSLFAEESAEIYFIDYGEARLSDGMCHIELDPTFLQTVTVDARHPIKVFVQVEGDCNGVYVTNKTQTGFDVLELQEGKSNVPFSYRVVCKRKYYEDLRLATPDENSRHTRLMMGAAWPEVIAEYKAKQARLDAEQETMVEQRRMHRMDEKPAEKR